MRVVKRRRKRAGKVVPDSRYTVYHRFSGDDRETSLPLDTTDKRVAEKLAREWVEREERRRAGLLPDERLLQAASRPLREYLADYVGDLRARKCTYQYVWDVEARVLHLLNECGWKMVADVTVEGFTHWRSRCRGKAAKTLNGYLQAMRSFLQWMKKRGYVNGEPLANVDLIDARGRETFTRVAYTVEEFQRLLNVSGPRGVLYLAAVQTAFRRKALYGLTWADVQLDTVPPCINLPARLSKNRTALRQPIKAALAEALRQLRPSDAKPTDRVFGGKLLPSRGLDHLKADLKCAGLEYETADRAKRDFHAFRHTAATWGGNTGVAGPLLQAFTGHKTASQVTRYIHPEHLGTQAIIDRLPDFKLGTALGTAPMVASGQSVAQPGTTRSAGASSKSTAKQGVCRELTGRVTGSHKDGNKWAIQDSNL